jgi:hypothetical protein
VLLLPFIEAADVYDEFRLDEPWDSPHNLQLLAYMPEVYRAPGDPPDSTTTRIVTLAGEHALFGEGAGPSRWNASDGASRSVLRLDLRRAS